MSLIGQKCPTIGGLQYVKGTGFDIPGHGGPTNIEFWASWCGPCRMVFPHLSKIAREYRDKGLRVVGVSLEADSPQMRKFVEGQVAHPKLSLWLRSDSPSPLLNVQRYAGLLQMPRG